MSDLINGREMLKRYQVDLCYGIACKDCSMLTEEGGCRVEKWIDTFPSADRPQSACEYGEYCMCATCHYQEDCSYCADCTEAQKQMHDVWTCTKYMRKEHLRKGADDETD